MGRSRLLGLVVLLSGFMAGCAGPAGAPFPSGAAEQQAGPSKTLVVVGRAEPPSLSSRAFRSLGLTPDLPTRIFNAHLTIRNDAGVPVPYLAQAVPELNTDTWRVNPDGTMETTYRLKPNTIWHDGQPLTADDFVFAQEVFAEPALAANTTPPGSLIDRVTAPDPRTVVIRWKQTYPYADGTTALGGSGTSSSGGVLPPLPRHLLEQSFSSQDPEAFMANPFWTREYVGAGPYKLDQWEIGSFLEGVAFEPHILGKSRITRIREVFIADPNTALANVLAGQAALTSGDSIRFTDGETLRQQWGDRGQILNFPNLFRITAFQYRPEFASTQAFTDLRVRQALHYGVDFPNVNEAVQGGRTTQATGPIPPTASYYADLARAVTHYPFDPRKSEQLMTEAGFAKGPDNVWASPNPRYGRMSFETNVLANPDSENEMHIMADTWRKLGFEVKEAVLAPPWQPKARPSTAFPASGRRARPREKPDFPNSGRTGSRGRRRAGRDKTTAGGRARPSSIAWWASSRPA
jgi:peptide/nickel transport system substrate-binding protein